MGLVEHFRAMARNNAWSNGRLLDACAELTPEDFAATRTSFFPSLQATLNHILIIDWFYLDALVAGGRGHAVFDNEIPHPEISSLRLAQIATDRRLIALCDGLEEGALDREVLLDRAEKGFRRDTVGAVLPHLFAHQIHHRGQAHAMLAGTQVAPPQLDEFFLNEDADHRRSGLERLGLKDC